MNNYLSCYEEAQTDIYNRIASDGGIAANSYKGAIYIYAGNVVVYSNQYTNCYYGNGSIYQTGDGVDFLEIYGNYQCNYIYIYIYYKLDLGGAHGLLFLLGKVTLTYITIQYCRAQSAMLVIKTENGFESYELTIQRKY